MSVENRTTVNACDYNVSDYHQAYLSVRTEQIEKLDIPLRDVSLSYVTSLSFLFRLYDFEYSRGTQSGTSHAEMSTDNVTMSSTGCVTAGRQVLSNGSNVFLLDGQHRLEAMRLLHREGDLGRTQQHILVRLILQKCRLTVIKAEGTNLSKLSNKVPGILCRDFTFMDLMKAILDFANEFA